MRPTPSIERDRDDHCPGVLRLRDAADGALARVRLPGGYLTADALHVLARAASELGDGRLELTSRANIQLRGLAATAGPDLARRLGDAGLLPSSTHERVRNILASPLSGLDGPPLDDLVGELDRQLCADPELAELSGRFLFALDDGRGDVAGLGADLVAVVTSGRAVVEGMEVERADVPATLRRAAHAFLAERAAQAAPAWRVAELIDGRLRVRARLGATATETATETIGREPAGAIRQLDGRTALAVIAPLGRLDAAQAQWIADQVSGRPARLTVGRTIVVPDLVDAEPVRRQAEARGLGVGTESRWFAVTACAGRPGCAKALADVQADAAAAARPGQPRTHWSGCERRCGRPADTEIDRVATGHGYRVSA